MADSRKPVAGHDCITTDIHRANLRHEDHLFRLDGIRQAPVETSADRRVITAELRNNRLLTFLYDEKPVDNQISSATPPMRPAPIPAALPSGRNGGGGATWTAVVAVSAASPPPNRPPRRWLKSRQSSSKSGGRRRFGVDGRLRLLTARTLR